MGGGTTRRELFRLAGGLVVGAVGLAVAGEALDPRSGASLARSWLRDPATAIDLGSRYLGVHPEEGDSVFLLERSLGAGSAVGAARRFATLRRREFARGDTVVLEGWVVSRAEARLCALLALA